MIQKTKFAVILVAFSLFFTCFTNASPFELTSRVIGAVGCISFKEHNHEYSDCVVGEIHICELKLDTCKVTGQFNQGFKEGCKYEYQVEGCDKKEIPCGMICAPGTLAFEFYVKAKLHEYFGRHVKIYENGKCIAEACIDKV
ncbi:8468_t:CDS:1 [Diversispora eburnea]|uniref:8468_t:CDS:1 n=1 Tax=Diversispora eburnea TaxID=1213867 RepID=A0A9N9FYN9_9GLOM|nr:8468_t:CDS:1 [Diversispora eburnea]